jgi:hypothetical protein
LVEIPRTNKFFSIFSLSPLFLLYKSDIGISLYYQSLQQWEDIKKYLPKEETKFLKMNSFQEAKGFIEFTGDSALVVQYREESHEDLLQFFSKIPEEIDIIFVPHAVDEITAFYGLDSPYGVGHYGRLFTIRNLENHFQSIFPYPIKGSVHSLPVKVKQNIEIAIDYFRSIPLFVCCFILLIC